MSKENFFTLLIALSFGIIIFFLEGAVFLFLVFALIIYFIYRTVDPKDRKLVAGILISGFLLRVFLAVSLHAIAYLKGFHCISGDDLLYTTKGWSLVCKWEGMFGIRDYIFSAVSSYGINPYTFIIASFYELFGFHPVLAKMINCIIGVLIGWLSYLIGAEIFDKNTARISLVIVTFYPSLVRWSVANLKDPLIIFLIMLSFYIVIKIVEHKATLLKLILLAGSLAMLCLFSHIFYFTLIALIAAIAILYRLLDLVKLKRIKLALVVILCAIFILSAYYMTFVKAKYLIDFLSQCEAKQFYIAKSDSAGYYLYTEDFIRGLYNENRIILWHMIEIIFRNTVYFMLTPFPWHMTSPEQMLALPQMPLWYLLLLLSFFSFLRLLLTKKKVFFIIAVFLTMGVTISALVEGNIGAAFRHRDVFTPFFIIFGASAISMLINNTMIGKTRK